MKAFMLLFIVLTLLLVIPVFFGYRKYEGVHRVDRMAGDEGED